jgi:hypothetical protein
MRDDEQGLSWYDPESVRATIANGRANGIDREHIVEQLSLREFKGVPLTRVERIVDRTPISDGASVNASDLSQPEQTDAKPRDTLTNQLGVRDLEYLSNREAARLVGVALELFDGNTVRLSEATQGESDLVWHRQHMSVALRVVSTPSGAVGATHIEALVNGTTVPEDVRTPSELAIVTNRTFTEAALDAATEHDVHCFDAGHVEEWFRRARIPMTAVGILLEDGESHDGPLTDLVDIPPIPAPRTTVDPLAIDRAFDVDSFTTEPPPAPDTPTPGDGGDDGPGLGRSTGRDGLLGSAPSTPGQTGTLYADPNDDGDFSAFDRFVDDIRDEAPQQDASTEDTKPSPEEASDGPEEKPTAYADIGRKELMADLTEAHRDANRLQSWEDIQTHCSYPVDYYQKTFGSLTSALGAVGIEHPGESQ